MSPDSGFTFYKMSNLDSRISNADQLLTQVYSVILCIARNFQEELFCDSVESPGKICFHYSNRASDAN